MQGPAQRGNEGESDHEIPEMLEAHRAPNPVFSNPGFLTKVEGRVFIEVCEQGYCAKPLTIFCSPEA